MEVGSSSLPGNPGCPGERKASHRRRLYREGDKIFRLKIMQMTLAARTCNRLGLECEDLEIIREPSPREHRVEPRCKHGVLGCNTRRVPALMPVIVTHRC